MAAALIAGLVRGRDATEIEARLAAQPLREQALITTLTLVALFLAALLAGHAGLPGMLVFLLLVVLIVR